MDFAQLRAVKAALVAMCALALLVSGCAAPKSSEKQSTATLTGVVQDTAGNPIGGARVFTTFVGGFSGRVPVAVSDASGSFTVIDLPLLSQAVVVRVSAEAPGYTGGVGTRTTTAGEVRDIPITQGANSGVIITMGRGGITQTVTASGALVTASVPEGIIAAGSTPSGQAPVISVSIPAGAVSQDTSISVIPIPGSSLPVPPPASVLGGAPVSANGDAPGSTVTVAGAIAAVQLLPDGLTFPPGLEPTVSLPLPFALGTGAGKIPLGSVMPLLVFNQASGLWEKEADATIVADPANPGLAVAQFKVSHFSTREIPGLISVTEGAVSSSTTLDFPPLTSGKGYSVHLESTLVWNAPVVAGTLEEQELNQLYGALFGVPANAVNIVDIPPSTATQKFGLHAVQEIYPVTTLVTVKDDAGNLLFSATRSATRTRFFWQSVTTITPVSTIPVHLQGHVQGGGVGG